MFVVIRQILRFTCLNVRIGIKANFEWEKVKFRCEIYMFHVNGVFSIFKSVHVLIPISDG